MERNASSPGTPPVEFRDAIDELLRFTLESHINGSLDIDLGLSHHFCSLLLLTTNTNTENPCPPPPPYKRLALSLCGFVDSLALFGTGDTRNKDECSDLMLANLSQLVYILKAVNFELHVQEPFFTQLRDGTKTVEGRCAVGDYNRMLPGSVILFNKCLLFEVQEVRKYESFYEMLQSETLQKVLPGVETIEEGVQVYRKFYSQEKESSNGVLGLHVTKHVSQLYFPLARILSELSYQGVRRLLGHDLHVPIEQF